jgi:hypothetical protein
MENLNFLSIDEFKKARKRGKISNRGEKGEIKPYHDSMGTQGL